MPAGRRTRETRGLIVEVFCRREAELALFGHPRQGSRVADADMVMGEARVGQRVQIRDRHAKPRGQRHTDSRYPVLPAQAAVRPCRRS